MGKRSQSLVHCVAAVSSPTVGHLEAGQLVTWLQPLPVSGFSDAADADADGDDTVRQIPKGLVIRRGAAGVRVGGTAEGEHGFVDAYVCVFHYVLGHGFSPSTTLSRGLTLVVTFGSKCLDLLSFSPALSDFHGEGCVNEQKSSWVLLL